MARGRVEMRWGRKRRSLVIPPLSVREKEEAEEVKRDWRRGRGKAE